MPRRSLPIRPRARKPPLTVAIILKWADEFHARHGRWPHLYDGRIDGTADQTWAAADQSLRVGNRGLPGGTTLAKLLLHFSNFTPVVDFIHALTYVYQGAMAGRSAADGGPWYAAWIAALWSGDVATVIAGLESRQAEVGEPDESDGESSPRRQVAAALGYVRNQQGRMRYAEYRRDGLPITSCHVESAIKRVNRRVKGTEKFWSPDGAEAILQLRADLLGETDPLDAVWARRAAQATGERRHRRATPDTLAA